MPEQTCACFRGEAKLSGGKLAAITVCLAADPSAPTVPSQPVRIVSCRIDGDFFLEGGAAAATVIDRLERRMEGFAPPIEPGLVERELGQVISAHEGRLIGADAATMTRAFLRALSQGGVQPPETDDRPGPAVGGSGDLLRVADLDVADLSEWRRRWGHLPLRVSVDEPRPPAEQVALDLAMVRAVREGSQPPTLRIWNLTAPTVVIGRFQSLGAEVDQERARELGFTVVRRVTGGGAMFAQPDDVITYSLTVPASFADGLDTASTYRLNDLWLLEGLGRLGFDVGWSGMNDIASRRGKIGGAAQRRLPGGPGEDGGILHHDMLSYRMDADLMLQVLKVSDEKMRDKAVRSARSRVDPLSAQTALGRRQLVTALLEGLPDLAPRARLAPVGGHVVCAARRLAAERFSQAAWTAYIV
ncbi:lipoate--protein ligase family protein [Bifidobacterium xylocopae]|uniref:Ligase n=1 Tax=Bifidobacterium xylocopae TaxID=2493119 RepID=A0A366KBU6_9BIFI|nr:lipoate--protein ligase family protein [Bifidobacterium xylocopae]RBP99206.1 ligase [Bifidobacterium xylocopae]